MERLNLKVLILFFIKNLLETIYVLPIWFVGVVIFEKVWTFESKIIADEMFILFLNAAGILFFFLLMLACYYWSWLTYTHYSYELKKDGLHIKHGVILRKYTVIPYNAVEHIQFYINPFVLRFFDLYNLTIQTRELSNTDGVIHKKQTILIPGLTPETAKFLRSEIIKFSHISTPHKTFFDPVSGKYL